MDEAAVDAVALEPSEPVPAMSCSKKETRPCLLFRPAANVAYDEERVVEAVAAELYESLRAMSLRPLRRSG